MKIIGKGAESILYIQNNNVIKERIKKSYRIEQIDILKRKYPTRREAKLLTESKKAGVNVPNLIKMDDKEMKVIMEHIKGDTLKNIFNKIKKDTYKQIGEQIKLLHNNNIIHNDLTTSNMILKDNKVYFIDFGLGFISNKIEDKAVDLHLLRQALESKHYDKPEAFKEILKYYKPDKELLKRLEKVESRGRYKKRG